MVENNINSWDFTTVKDGFSLNQETGEVLDLGVNNKFKNALYYLNLKMSNGFQEKFLSVSKVSNLSKKIEDIENYKKILNPIDDFLEMKEVLKSNFYKKSNDRLSYFIHNGLLRYNVDKKSFKSSVYKENRFRFLEDFRFKNNSKTFEDLKVHEKEKGRFLHKQDIIYAHQKLSKVNYLDYYNKDKDKFFITLTLPNINFHKYNVKGNLVNTYKNEEKFEQNIFTGLLHLNMIFRDFYRLLKSKVSKYKDEEIDKKIDYVKVIEPHKSLDGHLHFLIYIDPIFEKMVEDTFNNTVSKFGLKSVKFEKLREAKGSSYLTKYLQKTNSTFNYYKHYFSNINMFTTSNFRETTQDKIDFIYKYLYKNNKKLLDRFKKSKTPLYVSLENLIVKKYFEFEEEEKEGTSVDFNKIYKEYTRLKNKVKNSKKFEDFTYFPKFSPKPKPDEEVFLMDCKNSKYKFVDLDSIDLSVDTTINGVDIDILFDKNLNYKEKEQSKGLSKQEFEEFLKDYQGFLEGVNRQIYTKQDFEFEFSNFLIENHEQYTIKTKVKNISKVFFRNKKIYDNKDYFSVNYPTEFLKCLMKNPFIGKLQLPESFNISFPNLKDFKLFSEKQAKEEGIL